MCPRFSCLLFLVVVPLMVKGAGLESSREFLAARQALADGLPEVAGVKAERLLERKSWSRAEARALAVFAAEAWTRARNAARVLKLADEHDLEEEAFWRAQAAVFKGDLGAAREELAASKEPRSPKARLLLAQILKALGEHDAAQEEVEILVNGESLPDEERRRARLLLAEIDIEGGRIHAAQKNLEIEVGADDPEARLLRARCFILLGDTQAARAELRAALDSSRGGERTHHVAGLMLGEVMLAEKQVAAAWTHLMTLLDGAAESAVWTEAFEMLDRTWRAQMAPRTLPAAVLAWIGRGNTAQQSPAPSAALAKAIHEFRGHALYVIASWMVASGREVEAVSLLETFLQTHADHVRVSAAMRLAMEIHARKGAEDRALQLAEAWHVRFSGGEGSTTVDFLSGDLHFRRGDYARAGESFQGASNVATTLSERRRALYNAGVSAVHAGDLVLYLGLLAQLEVTGGTQAGTTDSAADLELSKALHAAASHREDAEDGLRTFLTARPYHPRRAEAQVALAECQLLAVPPRASDAKATLDRIKLPTDKSEAADKLRQRVDYMRLWIREVEGDLKGLITDAQTFAKDWPASPLLPDVLLKTAAAHFRLEDFASARTQFEILAKDHPDSVHTDTALYFAALSAMSVMSPEGRERAMAIWEALAKKGGALAVPSRRQQALVLRRQGDLTAALKILDQILATAKLDVETRRLATCEKAEVLLLQGKKEPNSLEEAAKLLRAFLNDGVELPFLWRARAGLTLAMILRDARSDSEALEACYDVLRAADRTPPANPAEYQWFTKAGFFGIELLETAHQWEAAARLAEQMAEMPGDRAADARQMATKIRLAHFLWDGPKPVRPVQPVGETPPAEKTEPKGGEGSKQGPSKKTEK